MDRFHIIEDGACILFSKGVYRQAKVFRCGRDIFAAYGSGYIKIGGSSGTSNPNVAWRGLEADGVVFDRAGGQPRWADAPRRAAA